MPACSPDARCWSARRSRCRSNAWRAAISRDPAGRTTRRRAPCAASRCRRAARIRSAAAPIFTPATKATSGHDVNISEAEAGALVGEHAGRDAAATDAGALRLRRRARRIARHHPGRHEVRVRADGRGRRDAHRRGDDARLVPVLAEGRVRPGGPQPSFDKQFVRDYLEQIAGTSSRRCRRCPTRSWCGRARNTSRRFAA